MLPSIFAKVLVIVIFFPLHACVHTWVAEKLGDSTARDNGRFTLNPFRQLDIMGILMMILSDVGYEKAVPVFSEEFRRQRLDFILTALAGPVFHILMAILFLILAGTDQLVKSQAVFELKQTMLMIAMINIKVAIFNLIPFPPLDGSRVLMAFLSDRKRETLLKWETYTPFALFAAVLLFYLFDLTPVTAIARWIFNGLASVF